VGRTMEEGSQDHTTVSRRKIGLFAYGMIGLSLVLRNYMAIHSGVSPLDIASEQTGTEMLRHLVNDMAFTLDYTANDIVHLVGSVAHLLGDFKEVLFDGAVGIDPEILFTNDGLVSQCATHAGRMDATGQLVINALALAGLELTGVTHILQGTHKKKKESKVPNSRMRQNDSDDTMTLDQTVEQADVESTTVNLRRKKIRRNIHRSQDVAQPTNIPPEIPRLVSIMNGILDALRTSKNEYLTETDLQGIIAKILDFSSIDETNLVIEALIQNSIIRRLANGNIKIHGDVQQDIDELLQTYRRVHSQEI